MALEVRGVFSAQAVRRLRQVDEGRCEMSPMLLTADSAATLSAKAFGEGSWLAEPQSLLTAQRPDLWRRGISMAVGLTGYRYAHKDPLADGTIYACGGHYVPPSPEQIKKREEEERLKREEDERKRKHYEDNEELRRRIDKRGNEIIKQGGIEHVLDDPEFAELWRKLGLDLVSTHQSQQIVLVPEGSMEWLLHEVGHWIAATPEQRMQVNYGLSSDEYGPDGEQELEAWAFELLVLGPYGDPRNFASPMWRDGAGFAKSGPLPHGVIRSIERKVEALGLDLAQWRALWGEWVRWGRSIGDDAPWITTE
jgi:hypothetical protein